jgi:secreted PhoX family phosphatase
MYVIEDNPFGDIWACLPDGEDRNIKTDGCVKMLSVRDSSAEPTGFAFTGDGKTAYFHIQHSSDSACLAGTDCASNDGYPTDDLIKISGFKLKKPH